MEAKVEGLLEGAKGAFYIDKKGREVLYVPLVCVVINYSRKIPEVILDPRRLKLRAHNWKKGRVSLKSLISLPRIDKEDITTIIDLCAQNKISEAKGYCIDVFDQVANEAYGIESRRRRRCQ